MVVCLLEREKRQTEYGKREANGAGNQRGYIQWKSCHNLRRAPRCPLASEPVVAESGQEIAHTHPQGRPSPPPPLSIPSPGASEQDNEDDTVILTPDAPTATSTDAPVPGARDLDVTPSPASDNTAAGEDDSGVVGPASPGVGGAVSIGLGVLVVGIAVLV